VVARSQGVALRRGLTLVLMDLVLPGSAQLSAGNRGLGKAALRVWGALVVLVLAAVAAFFANRQFLIGLYTNPATLLVLAWGVVALGAGWILLLLDAWRIANPGMSGPGRVLSGALALALAVVLGAATWNAHAFFGAQVKFIGQVFQGGGETEAIAGRYNILLLGGDAGADRVGMRPDSMTVASIDARTGRTVLFSLPRNLQKAPFPADSPLHKLYPNGFYCPEKPLEEACLLNGINTLAEDNKSLFKGVKHPGVIATRDSIEEILGIQINYWAMIDLKGFQKLIDAVGGITLDIGKRIPIGSSNGPKGVYGYIEPGKNVHLDGFHALWFARSRQGSNDYERMVRQKCVMNAMVKQLDPMTVYTKFTAIADAASDVVATDLPADQLGVMADLALKVRGQAMKSVSFVPPLIEPADPDFDKIRQTVSDAIAASEALDDATPSASASASASKSAKSSKSASAKASASPSSQEEDLDSVCAVSK
jgi:LCP family protein required for cell wall assembly